MTKDLGWRVPEFGMTEESPLRHPACLEWNEGIEGFVPAIDSSPFGLRMTEVFKFGMTVGLPLRHPERSEGSEKHE